MRSKRYYDRSGPQYLVHRCLDECDWQDDAGITTGPDRNLWFTEESNNKIGRITTTSVVKEFKIPTRGSEPSDITAGPDGNLWFTEFGTGKIGKITILGAITEYMVPPKLALPLTFVQVGGIITGPDRNLWFALSSKLGRITTRGTITAYPLARCSFPSSVASGPDGNVWFHDVGCSKVGKLITPR